jgi:hypothetical protein
MADLNALIAQGAQFKAPVDPFAQYGQMQQLEQASSTNQLNRMKMDEYQRGLQEQNALRGLDPAAADYLTQIKKVNPKLGFEFGKLMQEGENLKLTGLKTQADVAKAKKDMLGSSLRDMASNPSDENIIAHTQDYALNPLFKDDLPSIQANAKRLLAMTPDQRKAVLSGTGATAADLKPPAPTNIANLIRERNALPQGDPSRKLYDQQINDLGAATRNAQQRLAFDQAKFEWEKKNPTKSIQDDGTGLVAVDTRTGIATPVVYGANGIQAAPAAPSVTVDGRSFPGARTEAPASLVGTRVPGKGAGAPTEGERKAATLLQRLQGSQNQLTQALLDDPTAAGPEAFAAAVGKLSTTGANLLNSEERQRVEAAQLDILDAALTLGTGAAYTREQLEGYRQSYFPIYGDKPKNIKDKQARLQNVIDAANIAAGKAGKLVPKPPPVTGGSDVRSAADKILGAK